MDRHIPISNLGWHCHEGGRGRTGPDGFSEYGVLQQLRLIRLKALNGFVCPPCSTLGVCDEYRDKRSGCQQGFGAVIVCQRGVCIRSSGRRNRHKIEKPRSQHRSAGVEIAHL